MLRSLEESGVINFKQVVLLIVVPLVLLLSLSFLNVLSMQGGYIGGQPMESILVVDSILVVLSSFVENLRAMEISLLAAFLVT